MFSDYVYIGKYCGLHEKMCSVKQLVLRIWGPGEKNKQKRHFKCFLLWITSSVIPGTESPFVDVVPGVVLEHIVQLISSRRNPVPVLKTMPWQNKEHWEIPVKSALLIQIKIPAWLHPMWTL